MLFMQSYIEPGQGTDFKFIFNLGVAFAVFCPLALQTVMLPQWGYSGRKEVMGTQLALSGVGMKIS